MYFLFNVLLFFGAVLPLLIVVSEDGQERRRERRGEIHSKGCQEWDSNRDTLSGCIRACARLLGHGPGLLFPF